MRRRRKRNYKFWAIVRAKSKRHYGKRSHGGLRIHGVSKKYQSKGHFDPVKYAYAHSKGKSGLAGLKDFWGSYRHAKYGY